jgi:TPR repeat protein
LPRRRAGLASAQTLLGECYAEGRRGATIRWRWRGIRKAALQNDPYAQLRLG